MIWGEGRRFRLEFLCTGPSSAWEQVLCTHVLVMEYVLACAVVHVAPDVQGDNSPTVTIHLPLFFHVCGWGGFH
jgi:hypothetical protein